MSTYLIHLVTCLTRINKIYIFLVSIYLLIHYSNGHNFNWTRDKYNLKKKIIRVSFQIMCQTSQTICDELTQHDMFIK
jgi:hypothetical protein